MVDITTFWMSKLRKVYFLDGSLLRAKKRRWKKPRKMLKIFDPAG
jgi:hypothetical protein